IECWAGCLPSGVRGLRKKNATQRVSLRSATVLHTSVQLAPAVALTQALEDCLAVPSSETITDIGARQSAEHFAPTPRLCLFPSPLTPPAFVLSHS
ncbi:hypothetical protein BDW22DRAFT_1374206, partial [Trametopsis cervina]